MKGSITIGLESKGTNDEWFRLIRSTGRINTNGKTIHVSNLRYGSRLTIPKGENMLRAVLTVMGNLKLSADVTLSS